MNLVQKFTKANRCFSNPTKITVKGIVLHSTGTAQPSADRYYAAYNTAAATKAVHAFLQPDGYVMQTLPWDYKAWHCGGSYNNDHIGIEMTEPSTIKYLGGAQWTDLNPNATLTHVIGTYKVAVQLFGNLCQMYMLNPVSDGVIVSHSEAHKRGKASGHSDVEHIWNKLGLSMNQFRKDVQTYMTTGKIPDVVAHTSTGAAPTTPTKTTPAVAVSTGAFPAIYQVNIQDKTSSLNIRDLPNGAVIDSLTYNQLTIINKVENDWGQLSTGGWVMMKFMKAFNNGFKYTPKKATIFVKVDNLNIRSTPEIKVGNVVGSLNKGKKYTIIGTCNDFGLLMSSAGNVNLNPDYVTIS